MRAVIRLFFRGIRLILTPFMLVAEKLSTPAPVKREPKEQLKVDKACQQLVLYQFLACPFCIKVRKEIARLGLRIEKRDAQHNAAHRAELEAGGGRVKVPCLRIENEQAEVRWLYESNDIMAYLQQQFELK
ncbi:glutathione S-transferase N-terminal domain-containing protein [Alkalimonas sp.]|uniref:glutaredoxin family protein n=1 Tax=Alkalimonas sp. TaxID=1872453 RepID=UPI00263AEE9D|nr:glutathione S-transferase N-terminal domain-containing protein [Alkalimonas sp.]MCC5825894.1 glutathione S-transferase N-terminal domain-containing protein [Alkalimonas sp.]